MKNINSISLFSLKNKCDHFTIRGEKDDFQIKKIGNIFNADSSTLTWLNPERKDKEEILKYSNAGFIVKKKDESYEPKKNQVFIEVNNPKLFFSKLVNIIIDNEIKYFIDPTAIIHPEAEIDNDVFIGPYSVIGKCKIGRKTIIQSHCHIFDDTNIGSSVLIGSGSKIGNTGYGYSVDEKGIRYRFPHLGGVIIEDSVEIGSNVCIDKGSLGNTVIRKNVKIDNLVHIAHNVEIGERTCVVALAMIGGSTKIGNDCWVSPAAVVRDVLVIGNQTTVGMGAIVTKNIPDGQTWAGNPAKILSEFVSIQKKINNL